MLDAWSGMGATLTDPSGGGALIGIFSYIGQPVHVAIVGLVSGTLL